MGPRVALECIWYLVWPQTARQALRILVILRAGFPTRPLTMKGSFLSLNGHVCAELEQHIADHSSPCSSTMTKQWLWSSSHRPDADKMCSMAQLSWLKNTAMDRKAKRVLDIGCYTGLSAMAWFEGTATTNAEILTIEADSALAAVAQQAFTASGYDARITIKQGWAAEVLPTLTGTFDVVFVDIAFDAYQDTVRAVLDLQLLAPDGIILVDNEGLFPMSTRWPTLSRAQWDTGGKQAR